MYNVYWSYQDAFGVFICYAANENEAKSKCKNTVSKREGWDKNKIKIDEVTKSV